MPSNPDAKRQVSASIN